MLPPINSKMACSLPGLLGSQPNTCTPRVASAGFNGKCRQWVGYKKRSGLICNSGHFGMSIFNPFGSGAGSGMLGRSLLRYTRKISIQNRSPLTASSC